MIELPACVLLAFTSLIKNTTVLSQGCKPYITIGCIHTSMVELKSKNYRLPC